jgi:signal transduction histidine kinase
MSPQIISLHQHRVHGQTLSQAALEQSAGFLSAELSARVNALQQLTNFLPSEVGQAMSSTDGWQTDLRQLRKIIAQLPGDTSISATASDGLQQIAADAITRVESRLQHLGADFQGWLVQQEAPGQFQPYVDTFFSRAFYLLVGLRVLAAHHRRLVLWARDESSPPVVTRADVGHLLQHSIEDARGFAREKYGVLPEVDVHISGKPRLVCADGHLMFIFHEVIKNAFTAHNVRYGIDADDGPAIDIRFSRFREVEGGRNLLRISVQDYGYGLTDVQQSHALSWLSTQVETAGGVSRRNDDNPHWKYTRDMGSQFSGYGIGLPLSRTYCWMMGGDLELESVKGEGTIVNMLLDTSGHLPWIPSHLDPSEFFTGFETSM